MRLAPSSEVSSRALTIARPALKRVDNLVPWGLIYRGDAVECPCCHGHFRRMRQYHGRRGARCPGCGSLERHRLLWLYLRDETPLFSERLSVLHFAPEPALEKPLRRLPNLRYTSADLRPTHRRMLQVDITDIPFADGSFDVVICNHVLEHVIADRGAMAEVRRVLLDGRGWAVMQHPIDERRAHTYEDPAMNTPSLRREAFGQDDHVRVYGRDFRERLIDAGFVVERREYAAELSERIVQRYALRQVGGRFTGEDIHHLQTRA